MTVLKFANVLLESNERSMAYPTMWHRSDRPVVPIASDGTDPNDAMTWELCGFGTTDFTTYFNALSVKKLRSFTMATRFLLHLELRGAACVVTPTIATTFSQTSQPLNERGLAIPASTQWTSVDIDLDPAADAVLAAFQIVSKDTVYLKNGYYAVEIPGMPRPVELALATTTFKKESYILPNIAAVKRDILGCSEDIARHFHMHVIDNGRTLDAAALSNDGITVYPNDNVGGAGGFARGMIEAMRQDVPATNVLLMDDDVAVSPESIKRTYNLLRILNDEYAEAFISGAMLSFETPDLLWEDMGYMTPEGTCMPIKPAGLRMTLLPDLVLNEKYRPSPEKAAQSYAAWWYCCIPTSTIRREGLPLPVFVRFDDIEYGLRCRPQFITMNGIGIWHMAFHPRYNAAVERYQTTRNALIGQCTTGMAPASDFLQEFHHNVQLELKKYNYADAELALEGFEDFLKGPAFIRQRVAEQRFMDANHAKEQLIPFDELDALVAKMGIEGFHVADLDRQAVDEDEPRSKLQSLVDLLTCNRQRTLLANDGTGYGVITSLGFKYQPGRIRGKRALIVIDYFHQKGTVRLKDHARFRTIIKRYKTDVRTYKKNIDRLRAEYAAARAELTSETFWKSYLGIE